MRSLVLVAVAAAALFYAATASANHYVSHRPFGSMTPTQREHWLARQAAHDRGSLLWLDRHLASTEPTSPLRYLLDTPYGLQASLLRQRWLRERDWYQSSLRIVTVNLTAVRRELEPLWPSPPADLLPAFRCIGRGESGNGSGSSNLYGMLAGWSASYDLLSPRQQAAALEDDAWHAPPDEQLYRAWKLQQADGWSPWTTAPGCGL